MDIALRVILVLFCLQGLAKFALWLLVPYQTRIGRIASYYARDGRVIGIYDSVALALVVVLVGLLAAAGLQDTSFITGLIVGMLLVQVFFHRFDRSLAPGKQPPMPAPPRQLMSYAIQAQPSLGWREIALMAALQAWAVYALLSGLVSTPG